MRQGRVVPVGFVLAGLLGCGEPPRSDATPASMGSGATSEGEDSSGADVTGASETSGGDDDAAGDDDTGLSSFDVGDANPDAVPGSGCQKVDFLFVVDNSGSMRNEQENLVASFPGFMQTLQATIEASDYQILVTDVNTSGVDLCSVACAGSTAGFCASSDEIAFLSCGDILPLASCDMAAGAGRVRDSDYQHCPIDSGGRFLNSGQSSLSDTFGCVADRGLRGVADEHQAEAMWTALSPELNDHDACNEGFLRDDALLVVTLITDEDDRPNLEGSGSPGEPADWYGHVVAAKGGNAESVVMLSILGVDDPLSACDPGPRLQAFTERFPNHRVASVCEPDYAPFFEEAVGIVDLACDAFEPEG